MTPLSLFFDLSVSQPGAEYKFLVPHRHARA